jgi:hypothetical protein
MTGVEGRCLQQGNHPWQILKPVPWKSLETLGSIIG